MSCQEMEELLSAYVDRQASGEEEAAVARHLEYCGDCRREVRLLGAIKRGVGRVPSPVIPQDLRAALLGEARRVEALSRRGLWRRLAREWSAVFGKPLGWGLAAAFAAAGVAIVVRISSPGDEIPLEVMLAAHDEYAMTMPLAPRELILSDLPEPAAAGGSDGF